MVSKKFVSKVDEKLRAAEARRAELERAKAEEIQKKLAMRRDRMKKTDENATNSANNSNSSNSTNMNSTTVKETKHRLDVKSFKYMRVGDNGKLYKLNWDKEIKTRKGVKLFTIATVESLINNGEFEMAQVLLGIMRKAVAARHPIQNKFAHLHGRIVEIKEKNKRAFTHESALNFTGSISPVRLPEFEVDLNQLSRISSPVGMEELSRKYEGSIDEVQEYNNALPKTPTIRTVNSYEFPMDDGMLDHVNVMEPKTPLKSPVKSPRKTNTNIDTDQNNFPTVISPMKRPHKDIEAETVYTPQRKSARRLESGELIYDDAQVSEILLNDPNAAFISNPYIPTVKKHKRQEEDDSKEGGDEQ